MQSYVKKLKKKNKKKHRNAFQIQTKLLKKWNKLTFTSNYDLFLLLRPRNKEQYKCIVQTYLERES